MKRLCDIGEDDLVNRLLKKLSANDRGSAELVVGPGDDCAVIDVGLEKKYQLLKTDSLVEGVHYLPDTPATKVGWKAVARVVSDFAAMGGWPSQFMITIAMPPEQEVAYVERLYQGMQKCATDFGVMICGGETTSVPDHSAAMISVSGTGWVEKNRCVTRSGGEVGDLILVTGKLGGSIHGKHLEFRPRVNEARWLTENFMINSMMDLSDGLGKDLVRLAKASGCGFEVDESSVPCTCGCELSQALGDGEDYELLMTVSRQSVSRLCEAWRKSFPALPLTVIGELVQQLGHGFSGTTGWEHFKS